MSVRIHSRQQYVASARYNIANAISKAVQNYGITPAEITHILAQEILGWNKYAIQDERFKEEWTPRDEAESV